MLLQKYLYTWLFPFSHADCTVYFEPGITFMTNNLNVDIQQTTTGVNLMFIGPCIIVITEEYKIKRCP